MLIIKDLSLYLKQDLRLIIKDFNFTLKPRDKVALIGEVYISGKIDKVHVGMKQVHLSDTITFNAEGEQTVKSNSPVTLYDTSGPYSDPRYIPSLMTDFI